MLLLDKLCERKDKTALSTCTAHCSPTVRDAKINLQNNICGTPIEFATFSRTVVITPGNNTKHQFPCHRKFMKHRVKRDLG